MGRIQPLWMAADGPICNRRLSAITRPHGTIYLRRLQTYKLGGYQVLKKWLSYRESKVLDRNLLPEEVQHFTDTARRIGAILRIMNGEV